MPENHNEPIDPADYGPPRSPEQAREWFGEGGEDDDGESDEDDERIPCPGDADTAENMLAWQRYRDFLRGLA